MSEPKYLMQVSSTIRDFPSVDWDTATATSIGLSHAMLSVRENYSNLQDGLRYFLFRHSERPVAACVAYEAVGEIHNRVARIILSRVSPRLLRWSQNLPELLLFGIIRAPCVPVALTKDCDRQAVIRTLCDELERYADARNLFLGFAGITHKHRELSGELKRRSYLQGYGLPEAFLRINRESQKPYLEVLKSIKPAYAKKARTEINRFRRSGITIRQWHGADEQPLYELLKAHHDRKNSYPFEDHLGALSELKSSLRSQCLVFAAYLNGTLVGVSILLQRDGSGWLWNVGIDHEAEANNFTYFNLMFYHVYEQAVSLGLTEIWYGPGVLDAKARRGCEVQLTDMFLRPPCRAMSILLRPAFSIQRAWYARKFAPVLTS